MASDTHTQHAIHASPITACGTTTRPHNTRRGAASPSRSAVSASTTPGPAASASASAPASASAASTKRRADAANGSAASASASESRDGSAQPSPAGGHEPPKKRRTGAGSRGVANLTPEQLAKKRANDREAQRAIRERTKMQIEGLERRVQELTSQQPYQELQAVMRAKEAVEAENAQIKQQLATIIAMIQPLISPQQVAQPVLPPPGQPYLPVQSAPAPTSGQQISTPSSAASPPSVGPYSQWDSGATSNGVVVPQGRNQSQPRTQCPQRHDAPQNLDLGGERLGLGFLLDPSLRGPKMQDGPGEAQKSTPYRQISMKPDISHTSNSPYDHQTNSRMNNSAQDAALCIDPALANYSTPINNCASTCPLDRILLDFLNERRQLAAGGLPSQEIVGPRYPSVSSLLNPQRSQYSHPLSKVFIDILQTFPDISRLPERVAVLYTMFLLMRWAIQPTQENHERLPPLIRPRHLQLFTPHPAWVDHLPFPEMRDRIIRGYAPDGFPFEHFFIPYTTTLSLNWPYDEGDVLLPGGPDSDELVINPVFEKHLRRPENWTLGEAFAKAFPMLDGTYNLQIEGNRR